MLYAVGTVGLARKGSVDGMEEEQEVAPRMLGRWWNGEYQDLALSSFYTLA